MNKFSKALFDVDDNFILKLSTEETDEEDCALETITVESTSGIVNSTACEGLLLAMNEFFILNRVRANSRSLNSRNIARTSRSRCA